MSIFIEMEVFIMEMKFAGTSLPLIQLDNLFHVGSLDIQLKSKKSLEGSGLSVSYYPEEWRSIARLGDSPVWLLKHSKNGGYFVDFHKLSEEQKAAVKKWGVENSYVEEVDVYRIELVNEYGDSYYYLTDDPDIAREEFIEYHELEEDTPFEKLDTLTEKGLKALAKLKEVSMQVHIDLLTTFDILLTVWAERLDDVNGVYWDDELDEFSYSAPRGVLFNSRKNQWKTTIVEE